MCGTWSISTCPSNASPSIPVRVLILHVDALTRYRSSRHTELARVYSNGEQPGEVTIVGPKLGQSRMPHWNKIRENSSEQGYEFSDIKLC